MLVVCVGHAAADSIYLTCTPISRTNAQLSDFYKTSPPNIQSQLIADMLVEGLDVNVLFPAPESWVIDLTEGRIFSPEQYSGLPFINAKISKSVISADRYTPNHSHSFVLNRITGKLIYQNTISKEAVAAWRNKHGGVLPNFWNWNLSCQASKQPKF